MTINRLNQGTTNQVLVKAISGQTTNLLELQDSSGNVVSSIGPTGVLGGTLNDGLVAFDAYFSGTQAITSATFVKVTLNTENYDTNSNFDSTTNYRFTPTVEGYYQFNAQITWATSNTSNQLIIAKNNNTNGTTLGLRGQNQDSGSIWQLASGLLYMNGTTDYVELFAAHLAGTNKNLSIGRLQGILVRKA